MTDSSLGKSALQGLRVIDLTRLLPGGFCTQILADLGADVLKIEEPGRGDYNRSFEPLAKEESGSFLLLNRNKKSMTLNLKSDQGKEIFLALVENADIVVEGFRPGVMDRLGLQYSVLKERNPKLIYCAISGFGQDGPYRLKSGHDLNYMALAGVLPLFGRKGEDPIVPGLSIADVGGGSMPAITGILAAVIARFRSGKGQSIDISMTDGAMSWLSYHGADYLFGNVEPKGGERPFIGQAPSYNVYRCADGKHVALGIIEKHFWERFCDAVELEDLKAEQWPEGARADLQFERLSKLFATMERDEWVERLEDVDIPFSAVLNVGEAFADEHSVHRKMLMSVDHPVEGKIPQLGFPIKMTGTPCQIHSPPPMLGEHSAGELATLGYSEAEIEELRKQKII